MTILQDDINGLLLKKVIYGVTSTGTNKLATGETISSPFPVLTQNIWSNAKDIPTTPAAVSNIVKKWYKTGGDGAIKLTLDPSRGTEKDCYIACTNQSDPYGSRLKDFIPFTFEPTSSYVVRVYTDANCTNRIYPNTPNDFVFDYSAGVLLFLDAVPSAVISNGVWIEAYQYIGNKGLGGAGVNLADDQITYSDITISSGNYTFTNFFNSLPNGILSPQTNTITVYFNGVRIEDNQWSYSGKDLSINITNLGYPLESGDIISARYSWIA